MGAVVNAVVSCPSCGVRNRLPTVATGHPRCPKCRADLPWVVDADDDDFDAAVETDLLVLVDLWAPWCGPCRMVAPVLERLAVDFAGRLKVVKVNVDDSPTVALRHRAQSIPMLLFVRSGEVLNTVIGAQSDHVLRTLVEAYVRE